MNHATSPEEHRRRIRRIALAVGAALLAVTLLALVIGSRGGSSEDSAVGGAAADSSAAQPRAAAELSAAEDATTLGRAGSNARPSEPSPVEVPLEDRSVVRTGSVSLATGDVAAARREVLGAIEALGGYVADEQSRADDNGDLRQSDLTLKVPTDQFDEAMSAAGGAGTVTSRTQSARDVTEQVVDVQTRVASAEASLRRIRLLLGRASSLGDVIRLEEELSSRQADLEALQAQQQSLAAMTDLATMQVTIAVPPKNPPPKADTEEATGFLAGLSRGWDALASGYVTLATAAGTALPTLLVLVLLALLVRWFIRRGRRQQPVSPTPA